MKENLSVSVNKNLINVIDMFRGDTPRIKFINDSIKRGLGLFEALWIFREELNKISMTKKILSKVGRSSVKPVHKHSGFVIITQESVDFYSKKLDRPILLIHKKNIKEVKVGYDETFKKSFYPYSPPLKIVFDGKTMYLFLRLPGEKKFRGDDRLFLGLIRD